MAVIFYLLLVLLLLLLNAFFVLAEFSSVKVRPTQIEVFAVTGNRKAKRVQYIQMHLDEFLSVCQVGITLTSIGLGFVGEPAFAKLIKPLLLLIGFGANNDLLVHSIAITIGYLLISFLHIVIGELVPKSLAIRASTQSALFIAYPIMVFRHIFAVPIWLLNNAANLILRLIKAPPAGTDESHTEDEIRLILEQSQSGGMMSFRRLLHIENVLDLGQLTMRNAMRPRRLVCCIKAGATTADIIDTIARYRYSRYPLIGQDPDNPLGYIHVKDLFLTSPKGSFTHNLEALARPCLKSQEQESLEKVLSMMQRKGNHIALVFNKEGNWSGMVTLEDAVEEVIGTIEEEFPLEKQLSLSNFLSPERILVDVEGATIIAATRNALNRLQPKELPLSASEIMVSISDRERLSNSYVGHGLAIPHARLPISAQPIVIFAKLKKPIPAPTSVSSETVNFLFIILTPVNEPRIHQILLSHIAGIFESDFLETRLNDVLSPMELFNVISTAEQTVLA